MSPGVRQAHRGVVRRDGLHRQRARLGLSPRSIASCQRLYSGVPGSGPRSSISAGSTSRLVYSVCPCSSCARLGRQALLALLVGEARVGRAQLQVGHQPVEQPVAALDHHETAFLHLLGRDRQPDVQVFLQAAANDITDCMISYRP